MSQLYAINLYITNNIFPFHLAVRFSKYFHTDYVYAMHTAIRRRRISASLSHVGYLRLRDIWKLAQDSTSCQVRIKTKKNARCGKSGFKLLTRLPEFSVSQSRSRTWTWRDRVHNLLSWPCRHVLCMLAAWGRARHTVSAQGLCMSCLYWCPRPEAERADMFKDVTSSRSPAGPPPVAPYCHHRQEL